LSEHEPLQPLSASQREALEEATASYQAAVTADAARWLLARGIDRETAVTFRLGVVADPFPGHSWHQGKLAIPYLDREGRPLSMRFRCLAQHNCREFGHGKYMSLPDEPSRVFNVAGIHKAGDELHIAEGEFDAMVLDKVFGAAAGFPGAKSWKGHHRRMIAGFSRVYVWGDPDDAGAEFVQKVTRAHRGARGVRLRSGDVTDTYLAGGAAALTALINPQEAAA
jgi:hypothetical protein